MGVADGVSLHMCVIIYEAQNWTRAGDKLAEMEFCRFRLAAVQA